MGYFKQAVESAIQAMGTSALAVLVSISFFVFTLRPWQKGWQIRFKQSATIGVGLYLGVWAAAIAWYLIWPKPIDRIPTAQEIATEVAKKLPVGTSRRPFESRVELKLASAFDMCGLGDCNYRIELDDAAVLFVNDVRCQATGEIDPLPTLKLTPSDSLVCD